MAKGDLGSIEVAGAELLKHRGAAVEHKTGEILNIHAAVGGAMKDFVRLHIRQEHLVQPRHEGNLALPGRVGRPYLWGIAVGRVYSIGIEAIIVLRIDRKGHAGLVQVGKTGYREGLVSGPKQYRQQQPGQQRDNCDNYEQLHQGKAAPIAASHKGPPRGDSGHRLSPLFPVSTSSVKPTRLT